MALQHLRSSTANKRPLATALSDGQLAVNTEATSPGLFFKNASGSLVKVGPVHVGATAPNVSPASGGETGNTVGEQWLDTSGTNPVLKIWDGSGWASEIGEFVSASGDTMTGTLVMDNQQQIRFRETTANGTNYIAIQAPASVASDKTLTLPDVTGTLVSTGDTGTVTSTMIANGTIVDADINASAAITHSKLASVTAGSVLMGNASNVATATAVTGDVTISSSGVTAIASGAVVDADVNANAAIAHTKLANITAGSVLMGNVSNVPTATALTGDVTVNSSGVTAISTGAIVDADVNVSAAIAGTKISPDFGSLTVTTTGVFSAAAGAAATPSVTFTGDLNTGIYSPGADQVAISTAGTGRLFVDASGNVGIGTSSQILFLNRELNVNASSGSAGFSLATGDLARLYLTGNSTAANITTKGSIPLLFGTDEQERLRVTSAGLVGIGTSSPVALLQTAGTVSVTGGSSASSANGLHFYFNTTDNTAYIEAFHSGIDNRDLNIDAKTISLGIAGFPRAKLTSTGLGIGTAGPTFAGSRNGLTLRANSSNGVEFLLQSTSATDATSLGYATVVTGNDVYHVNRLDGFFSWITGSSGNQERMRIDSSGRLLVGTSSDSGGALLQVNGDRIRVATAKTPASATDTGSAGEICWDANYIYVCTATNTWKRTAISTW